MVMKRRPICVAFFAFLACAFALPAQQSSVKVRVRIVLVDKDLNQKPVPFLVVSLKGAVKTAEVKTGLDGTAEASLPRGIYTVTTPKAVELAGKRFSWNLQVKLSGGEQSLDLNNDNAKTEEFSEAAAPESAHGKGGDLSEQFKRLKNSVVTVRSELGHGTGFFVDNKGLVLTNQHVVGSSGYLAVQFDREHKIVAKLIAADPAKDVALLWVNIASFPSAVPAPLAQTSKGATPAQEGERVFTIGSPLSLEKIITTGIISKVQEHILISDININPGNSGGPLFNNAGQVVGLTTFGERDGAGPGVSGIVRIEEALALIEMNRAKATGVPPSGALLPVEPLTPYPVEGLKAALKREKFDARPYYLSVGDFNIALSTPPLDFREQEEERLQAERARQKRNKKHQDTVASEDDSDAPKEWLEEAGAHPAVFEVYVQAKAKEGVGAGFGRAFLTPNAPAKLKFKADFQKMQLFCGEKEVQPIHPGRVPVSVSVHNRAVKMEDATFKGIYLYPPDAINPQCGQAKLVIYSTKGDEPIIKVFDEKTVQAVWADFDAFRRAAEEKASKDSDKRKSDSITASAAATK
jgi:S1-C subfamily serine protease